MSAESAPIPAIPVAVGALVEFDQDGIPWRASGTEGSLYYFWDERLWVELDGVPVSRCIEFDRRGGWVRCRTVAGGIEQHFGTITARYRTGLA